MIEYALLWYNLYTKVLHKEGFVINVYDRCFANKFINGKQCTIAWYVDDNILSHVETSVVDSVIDTIEGYFPGLVVERGKDQKFPRNGNQFPHQRKTIAWPRAINNWYDRGTRRSFRALWRKS